MTQTQSGIQVVPLELPKGATEVDFGAQVLNIDLANISDEDLVVLKEAVFKHLVVVVPKQDHLTPAQQLHINHLFDPAAKGYGHGSNPELIKASVLQNDLISLPSAPEVKLLGNGFVAEHDGLRDVTLHHPSHHDFHKDPLPADDFGNTRFYRWHIDAALYAFNPARITTLAGFQVPAGKMQTIRYDDVSGDTLEAATAATAFISGEYAFKTLSPEARVFALKTKVRYHVHPYIWIKKAKALSTGLGMVSEGKEASDEDLPEWDEKLACILPAVWKNPVTGALALQIHPCCVEDLIVNGGSLRKAGGHDLIYVRQVVNTLMRPGIAPSRVLAHNWKPGDCVIFNNRSVLHTVTGTLSSSDTRVFHQCNLAGSDPPLCPAENEIDATLEEEKTVPEEAIKAFLQSVK